MPEFADLTDRVVLVTGSSQGIGRGCVEACAAGGADVVVNYRSSKDEADEVVAKVEAMGRRAIALKADVSDLSQVEELLAKTVEHFGRVDAVVSNAAFSDRKLLLEADMEGFRKTVDVSMWGAFYAVRTAAKHWAEKGQSGVIVVMSSPHAEIAIPTAMAYNMSKAAIDHMARTAAIELADKGIRVNLIHPGWIDTPGERKFFTEEQLEEGAKTLPLERLGTPEEIGRLCRFMLSDDAAYMTGSTVLMDGGVSLPWWSNREEGGQ